jgi:hypothetical protein
MLIIRLHIYLLLSGTRMHIACSCFTQWVVCTHIKAGKCITILFYILLHHSDHQRQEIMQTHGLVRKCFVGYYCLHQLVQNLVMCTVQYYETAG